MPVNGAGKDRAPRERAAAVTAFVTAPSIAWGPGAIEQLSALNARRAVVVVDRAVEGTEAPTRAVEELAKAGAATDVVASGPAPQRIGSIVELAERLRRFDPDWIVAIGGGATLDGAKAARVWFERPELPADPLPSVVPFPEAPRSHLVAIPTTSGSGAEASWTCDVDAEDGGPFELAHRGLVPDWALVDPAFAASLPAPARLAGGLETAAIAAEAFVSAWSNPFSDALAVGALTAVVRHLGPSLKWTDEPEARAALHYAATMAGLAASNAQRGAAHALARALERPTGLAYGSLLGLTIPAVLEFDRPGAREKLELLAAAVAPPGELGPRPDLASRLRRLADGLGGPKDLASAGVDVGALRSDRARLVARALRAPAVLANPRVPSESEIGTLLEALLGSGPASDARPQRG